MSKVHDLAIWYKGWNKPHIVKGVEEYGLNSDHINYHFVKDEVRSFLPMDNVLYFGSVENLPKLEDCYL